MKRVVLALTAVSLLAGCNVLNRGDRGPRTPTVGERIAILSGEQQVEVDPALAGVPVVLPAPYVNADWSQPGGNAAKSMGHVALGDSVAQAWSVSIGAGSGPRARLAAEPVVADGRIYTIDTNAVVRAISPDNGGTIWQTQVRGEGAPAATLFGGGVSHDEDRVYATNGAGYAAALDARTGAIIWMVRPGGPLRGAPTIANDNVYVLSQDNQLFALDPRNGETRWTGSGSIELSGVFGAATPAAAQGTVVAGYSSGELTAYRYENGRVVWQDALTRTTVSTAVAALADIDADPVIDQGRVYAIGQGGRMIATELVTGQRIWELNVAGISTPAVAGDWVFVVTDQAQLLAIARTTGRIRWMTQLPRYRNAERRTGPIYWRGPILAGNRLILVSSLGQMAHVLPQDGTIHAQVDIGAPVSLQPIVANNTLYILDDNGRLSAWR
ncbi:MAG: PQQ-binding-like beta-propeller repeat protein [Allosphingosinicella sp.]|uniref:outer membrane protein assembly factor BamB family protein n=1 Tax=Allosphingosinicella sp. TaxID=2823234 RepID=UPI00392A79EB